MAQEIALVPTIKTDADAGLLDRQCHGFDLIRRPLRIVRYMTDQYPPLHAIPCEDFMFRSASLARRLWCIGKRKARA